MHRGHDHHHHEPHGAGGHSHAEAHSHGHNHGQPPRAAQWQTPHLPQPPEAGDHARAEPDLDLVEKAFVESFATASDPTSFLRLARVPFEAVTSGGTRVSLLRVETGETTDVGAVMPHLGGGSFRYDPLPAAMASRRRTLRFVYFDGSAALPMTLAQVRGLAET
ncbi:hypothetical protein KHC23_15395 [Ancylobacter dichloromethanicus]|uniref:Uncharacterized protein n=1 Tax=Ancylobacter dichloromethanicus TaxID=518825 RepID=A0A9W6J7I1_9HYPH|nr:hypothetical protein [Ancylobacter dichloromethanicus]MBS7555032.1 hypothetical protein [Ancylobacter dichloromethanicus]GLK72241.1 hypothetical protein GCM10017643_23570 [Ancylobacter dichloromethanicus]